MFSSLCSWTYNLGSGALQRSTLRMKLNRGEYLGAADEFPKWHKKNTASKDGCDLTLPRLSLTVAQIYHDKVARLTAALNEDSNRAEAAEAIRALIEEVRLVPDDGNLRIELFGELAALINLTNEHPRSKETGVQVTLVAGAGFVQDPTITRHV